MKRSILVLPAMLAGAITAQAEVVFDGTLGPAGQLSGDMVVGEADGTRVGSNLFHSFETLNVNFGESLLFTSDFAGTTDNIVSRVTGNGLSIIDGLLWSDLPGTSLWLINPNGLVFGENAIVDVQGSFHASTADYLVLQDGGRFGADLSLAQNSTLSMANPTAFGFLGNNIGSISVQGSGMFVPYGETLELVGGDIAIDDAFFVADGGTFGLASPAGAGEVSAGAAGYEGADAWGDIRLTDSGVFANGDGGGAVFIRGGRFVMERSRIESLTFGAEDGNGIRITADDVLVLDDSIIDGTTFGDGRGTHVGIDAAGSVLIGGGSGVSGGTRGGGDGGGIAITAGTSITLDGVRGDGRPSRTSGSTFGAGAGGDTVFTAPVITVSNGAIIASNSVDTGNAGSITLNASESVTLIGTDPNGFSGGIFAQSVSDGDAADVFVNTRDFNVLDASWIFLPAFGSGDGGDLTIDASGDVTFAGVGLFNDWNLIELGAPGTGSPGSLTVNAANMSVLDGTVIRTVGDNANGGGVNLDIAGTLLIEGWTTDDFGNGSSSTIDSSAGVGNGGDIDIRAGQVIVGRGGNLRSDSNAGSAGAISIEASESILVGGEVDGVDPETVFGAFITAQSLFTGAAGEQGGAIDLAAPTIDILGGAVVATVAFNPEGTAGDINIVAGEQLTLQNTGLFAPVINSEAAFGATPGSIFLGGTDVVLDDVAILADVSFSDAQAGSVTVAAGNSILMDNFASITALNFFGSGGGDIRLSAPDIVMRNMAILASDTFGRQDGDAGDIYVDGTSLRMESGATIDANSCLCASGGAGNIFVNVDTLDIVGTGFINVPTGIRSTTLGSGDSGDIVINATTINMTGVAVITAESLSSVQDFIDQGIPDAGPGNAGSISITADSLFMSEGFIETTAFEAGGGNIDLDIADFLHAQRSSISASAFGTDEFSGGGNVSIAAPDFIILERGTISASANAGNGGNIDIVSGALIVAPFSSIDASSATGIDGTVSVESPNRLVASVTPLEAPALDVTALTQDPCEIAVNEERSSFTAPKSDGIVESPADYQSSPPLPTAQGGSKAQQCEGPAQ